jgi:hypothetical protein
MGGELIGKRADFAAAHGVRLAGQRERTHARPADAPGGEVNINDRIHLVGALRGLINPLRVTGDDALGSRKQLKEAGNLVEIEPARTGGRRRVAGDLAGARKRIGKAARIFRDIAVVESARIGEIGKQPAKKRGIHSGCDRQEQIRCVRRCSAPRIDNDQSGATLVFRGNHPLIEYRMAPRRVGADEHDQIGLVEIPVNAGHHVGAEGAAMTGNGRGHAQPRIAVDVGRAEKAFHQLVGDIVILGEQLAGKIARNRVRPVAIDDRAQSVCDLCQCGVPIGTCNRTVCLTKHGVEQALVERKRFAER